MFRLPQLLGERVHVPRHLDGITTVHPEVDAADVGLGKRAVPRVVTALETMFRTGLHPGVSLVVRKRGEVVVSRGIGHLQLGGDELMSPTTPTCLFSCSKAITALVLHKLAEDGVLELDDTVAHHLPAFAQNGKEHVTIRQLLTHRAGMAQLPFDDPDPMLIFDIPTMVDALCEAPLSGSSRQGYHAVTSGYILGAVAERASGSTLAELLARLLEPLGCADDVTYGVPVERRDAVALSYTTGATRLPPITGLVTRLLGIEPHVIAPATNTVAAMSSVVPSAGIWAGAEDACRIFQMLLDGGSWQGVPVLAPETVAEAVRPAGPLVIDAMLPAPIRFSAGFMLGERVASLFGVHTPRAFGHLGFTNILCWADPAREISVALLSTGKSVSPEGFVGMTAVATAISAVMTGD